MRSDDIKLNSRQKMSVVVLRRNKTEKINSLQNTYLLRRDQADRGDLGVLQANHIAPSFKPKSEDHYCIILNIRQTSIEFQPK